MGHPTIDEFCRIGMLSQMQPINFRKFQRVFRDEVQPQLEERSALLLENAALKLEVERLRAQLDAGEPAKRPVGRRRKQPSTIEVPA